MEDYGYAESIEINEEIRSNKQAVIKAKIVLIDGSVAQEVQNLDDSLSRIRKQRFIGAIQRRIGFVRKVNNPLVYKTVPERYMLEGKFLPAASTVVFRVAVKVELEIRGN